MLYANDIKLVAFRTFGRGLHEALYHLDPKILPNGHTCKLQVDFNACIACPGCGADLGSQDLETD